MKIELIHKPGYFLLSDSDNWIICKFKNRTRKKDGIEQEETYQDDARFFGRLDTALKWLLDDTLKTCPDLREIRSRIEDFKCWVKRELSYHVEDGSKAVENENSENTNQTT